MQRLKADDGELHMATDAIMAAIAMAQGLDQTPHTERPAEQAPQGVFGKPRSAGDLRSCLDGMTDTIIAIAKAQGKPIKPLHQDGLIDE